MAQDVVDVISKVLVSTVEKAIANAKFDKSMLGVVTGINGGTYTVSAFGGQYNITSDQTYTIGQSIVVTALQGDMKRLVCSPGNIGTVSTINTSVKKIDDRLSTFIDEDFADTIVRMDNMQDQIDGSFVSWFYEGEPTTENAPAKDWTTDAAKQIHINDLYYDTASGYSYKWLFIDNKYQWVKETNSGIQSALEAASKAQDTADGKRRTFYNTPSPPYDQGDVWMQGENADILICIVERKIDEEFSIGDWQKSCKYTDDTAAEKAQADVDALREEYEQTKEKVDNKIWMEDIKKTSNDFNINFGNLNSSVDRKIESLQSDITKLDSRVTQNEKDIKNRATTDEAKKYASEAKNEAINESKTAISALEKRVITLEELVAALSEKVAKYHPETDPTLPDQPSEKTE